MPLDVVFVYSVDHGEHSVTYLHGGYFTAQIISVSERPAYTADGHNFC